MTKPVFSLAIVHAAHRPERVESFNRLLDQLGRERLAAMADDGTLFICKEKMPYWEWSEEVWEFGSNASYDRGTTHHIVLQDDAEVSPNFWQAVEAMVEARPDQVIGLQSNHPASSRVYEAGHCGYFTYDDLIGVGYIFPKEELIQFLNWLDDDVKPGYRENVTEDMQIAQWGLSTGRSFWCPLPSPMHHDTEIPSVYGNDDHQYRGTFSWRVVQEAEKSDQCMTKMESVSYWSQTENPHLGRMYASHQQALYWSKTFTVLQAKLFDDKVCPPQWVAPTVDCPHCHQSFYMTTKPSDKGVVVQLNPL